MAAVTIDLPDDWPRKLGGTPEEFAQALRVAAAVFWYDRGEVSQGMGASIAGLNRLEFFQALGRYEVDALQVTGEELRKEVADALHAYRQRVAADLPIAGGAPGSAP